MVGEKEKEHIEPSRQALYCNIAVSIELLSEAT